MLIFFEQVAIRRHLEEDACLNWHLILELQTNLRDAKIFHKKDELYEILSFSRYRFIDRKIYIMRLSVYHSLTLKALLLIFYWRKFQCNSMKYLKRISVIHSEVTISTLSRILSKILQNIFFSSLLISHLNTRLSQSCSHCEGRICEHRLFFILTANVVAHETCTAHIMNEDWLTEEAIKMTLNLACPVGKNVYIASNPQSIDCLNVLRGKKLGQESYVWNVAKFFLL